MLAMGGRSNETFDEEMVDEEREIWCWLPKEKSIHEQNVK